MLTKGKTSKVPIDLAARLNEPVTVNLEGSGEQSPRYKKP